MNVQNTMLKPVEPQANVAVILGTTEPRPLALPEKATQTATAAHSVPAALQEEAAKFREQMRRRYEMPFVTGWDHGGLNE